MKTQKFANELLGVQLGEEKGICISIIVPLYKQLPQRNQNKLTIKNAMQEAKSILIANFRDYNIDGLIKKLDNIQSRETFQSGSEGVGLFIGENVRKIVHFPFEVKRKVIVDFSFEVRDMIFARHRLPEFFVLALSNNKTRLFKSQGAEIEEVINNSFPLSYEEQFQYPDRQKPKVSGSYGREESTIQEERQRNYFRHLDKLLAPYFKNYSLPVILLGVADQQNIFKKVTHYKDNITFGVRGNADHLTGSEIANKIKPEVTRLVQQKDGEVVDKLEKLLVSDKVIYGIIKVWKELDNDGKTLVVEKDYKQPGYLNQKSGTLTLHAQNGRHWLKISDLVDDVIESTLNGGGKIIFVGNGKLEKFRKIALIS